jgi:hypothetical protein
VIDECAKACLALAQRLLRSFSFRGIELHPHVLHQAAAGIEDRMRDGLDVARRTVWQHAAILDVPIRSRAHRVRNLLAIALLVSRVDVLRSLRYGRRLGQACARASLVVSRDQRMNSRVSAFQDQLPGRPARSQGYRG